jgi:hypothetical protein
MIQFSNPLVVCLFRLKQVRPAVAFSDLVTISFYGVRLLAPRPTPNLEDQASKFMSPGDRVAQLYPQAQVFYFSRLWRHAGVRWGYSSPPPHEGLWIFTDLKWIQATRLFNSFNAENCMVIYTFSLLNLKCQKPAVQVYLHW